MFKIRIQDRPRLLFSDLISSLHTIKFIFPVHFLPSRAKNANKKSKVRFNTLVDSSFRFGNHFLLSYILGPVFCKNKGTDIGFTRSKRQAMNLFPSNFIIIFRLTVFPNASNHFSINEWKNFIIMKCLNCFHQNNLIDG